VRPAVEPYHPRPGRLPESASEDAPEPAELTLDDQILAIMRRRGSYKGEPELDERSDDAGVQFDTAELRDALRRLWKEGLVIRPPVNQGVPRPGSLGNGRDDEGYLIAISGSRMFLEDGASAPLD
jgi:hypothetical protein